MVANRTQGPQCSVTQEPEMDDGTMCQAISPLQGVLMGVVTIDVESTVHRNVLDKVQKILSLIHI